MQLDKIPVGENPEKINVVIEIPYGSNIKYELDKESGAVVVDRVMYSAMFYPANYGFVPNTLSNDGDPADVLVLNEYPLQAGSVIKARLIGVLVMEDESGMDEKLLAVPVSKIDPRYDNIKSLEDLPKITLDRIKNFFETYKMPVLNTRCSNNYGPYQYPEKLIPFFISKLLKNEKVPVYGDGLNVRDWLYVYDHCSAIDVVLHKGRVGEVYNIGGHNERTNLQVVKTILSALGKPESLIKYVKDRPGHDRRYAIDPEKLERELGWRPKYNFDTGIKQTIQWYLDNKDWWERIISGEYQNYFKEMYKDRVD